MITEKATDDTERRNAYHFRVPLDANKIEIRRAVESVFKVKVLRVNTLRADGKMRRRGYTAGADAPLEEGHGHAARRRDDRDP